MSEFGSIMAQIRPSCICTASLDFCMQCGRVSETIRKPIYKAPLIFLKFLAWAIASLTAVIMLQLLQ